ncbi:MAG: hypothetical protein CBD49_00890 [Acidimicrobiaceae bacterium TMED189]|nr:MAG: hypothetical protein CBD49_00890 [Acidimicrobiaceae bacterium TMED189]|tara:strand:- start:2780 stop:2965 length:186 start_codon:yes stop_codon:yes gene_type:complete
MAKGKGYGSFGDTFGNADEQPYDSSSVDNMADMAAKAKSDAAYLRSTPLGNQAHGGRPLGK